MKEWKEERCSERPEELQDIGGGLYMERRNIREEKHEEDKLTGIGVYTDFVCESREISKDEYLLLKSIEAINTNKAIDEYTAQLLEDGVI